MALILAIQSDRKYTRELRQALCELPENELVVVHSIESGLDAIDQQVPDLVLVDALIPSLDVADLMAYLRVLPNTDYVQTISVPLIQRQSDFALASGSEGRPGWLAQLRKEPARAPGRPVGWDPDVFAADVADYLARMHTARSEVELRKAAKRRWTSERRRARRWRASEVSYIAARLLSARADLIDISAGGALVRTDVRPRPRRAPGQPQPPRPTLTLLQSSGAIVRRPGWPIRCHVNTIREGAILYDVAFQFNEDLDVGLSEPHEHSGTTLPSD